MPPTLQNTDQLRKMHVLLRLPMGNQCVASQTLDSMVAINDVTNIIQLFSPETARR